MALAIRFACDLSSGGEGGFHPLPYLTALNSLLGLKVRIRPLGVLQTGLAEEWNPVEHMLLTNIGEEDGEPCNVVCVKAGLKVGPGSEALVMLPIDGEKNVAIVSGLEDYSEAELNALTKYDCVVCPTAEGVSALSEEGVSSRLLYPESSELQSFFSAITEA